MVVNPQHHGLATGHSMHIYIVCCKDKFPSKLARFVQHCQLQLLLLNFFHPFHLVNISKKEMTCRYHDIHIRTPSGYV